MNVADIFLTLGIKGDTKSLDDAIKKAEELRKKTQELNKDLKETKNNSKINFGTSSFGTQNSFSNSSSNNNNLNSWAKEIKREEAIKKKRKVLAKKREKDADKAAKKEEALMETEQKNQTKLIEDTAKAETKEKTKQEKEQKKREKDREKSTKDFFNQIENGFSFIAKTFTGALVGGGIGGYLIGQAAKNVSTANLNKQFGIDAETAQKYANVFRIGSNGAINNEQTNAFIANVESQIGQQFGTNPTALQGFRNLEISPDMIKDFDSFMKLIRESTKRINFDPRVLTGLLNSLGFGSEFAQVLNAGNQGFPDKNYEAAFNKQILTQQEINKNAEIALAASDLADAFKKLQGRLISDFAEPLKKAFGFIETSINSIQNIKEGYKQFYLSPLESLKEGYNILVNHKKFGDLEKPKKTIGLGNLNVKQPKSPKNYNEKTGDFGFYGSMPANDWNQEMGASQIVNPTNNININTNINAASVDNSSIPSLVNGINKNVNGVIEKSVLLDSKYPRKSIPK